MSYIISKQQLDSELESKPKYIPYLVSGSGIKIQRWVPVSGHSLYDRLSDCYELSAETLGYWSGAWKYCGEDESKEKLMVPILPDGCASMVFQLKRGAISAAWLCGPVTEIRKLSFANDEVVFITRFLPGEADLLIKTPMGVLANRAVSLTEVIPGAEELLQCLKQTESFHERTLEAAKFLKKWTDQSGRVDHLIRFCTEYIFRRKGNVKISSLAEETGYSQRYISTVFERSIGMAPKTYCEIIQLQWSLGNVRKKDNGILMNTALNSGYFDHAHMNRMYRRFLHCTSGIIKKKGVFGIALAGEVEYAGAVSADRCHVEGCSAAGFYESGFDDGGYGNVQ